LFQRCESATFTIMEYWTAKKGSCPNAGRHTQSRI
jgi:hypothetical protein